MLATDFPLRMHAPLRRIRHLLVVAIVLAALPLHALAATGVLAGVGDKEPVSRGDFLRAAMDELDVRLMVDAKKLPYRRVPSALQPYIQTAHALGYLKAFGNARDLRLAVPITKGEAVHLIAVIESLQPSRGYRAPFRDVRPLSPLGRAVSVAIERSWIEPESSKNFGVRRTLAGRDARDLFSEVLQERGRRGGSQRIEVPVIKIGPGKEELPQDEIRHAIWDLLKREYLYQDRLQGEEGAGSVDGLIKSLNDPHTSYLEPVPAGNFTQQLQGKVTGIGAQVELSPGNTLRIITPLEGSPAEKAGLLPGDEILAVNGENIVGFTLDKGVEKVRGPEGSKAIFRIRRDGSEFDVEIVRATITFKEVDVTMDGEVAVVRLIQFGQPTHDTIRKEMEDLMARQPRGIVLDLRNNPGGFLHAAGRVLSAFLPRGAVYVRIHTREAVQEEKTGEAQIVPDAVPVVVLVNKGSASASEIVAAALQDGKRALIVGQTTYGKGTVQQLYSFPDGSTVKLTSAEFRNPSDGKIDGVGVSPDIEASDDDRDAQLRAAIDAVLR